MVEHEIKELPVQDADHNFVVLNGIEIHTTDMNDSNENEIKNLKEEVFQLRLELKNMNDIRMQENQELQNNMQLMEQNLIKKIDDMRNGIIKYLQGDTQQTFEVCEESEDIIPVGREIDNKHHLGENIWVDSAALKSIRLYSDSASKFVGNLVELIYTPEILKTHTVTGQQCNANKDRGLPAKPKLCPVRYGVALAEYKRWLNEQIMPEEERKKKLSRFNRYISSKQGTLNSDSSYRQDKRRCNYVSSPRSAKRKRTIQNVEIQEIQEEGLLQEVYAEDDTVQIYIMKPEPR